MTFNKYGGIRKFGYLTSTKGSENSDTGQMTSAEGSENSDT